MMNCENNEKGEDGWRKVDGFGLKFFYRCLVIDLSQF
jgi:hypothetical protein